MLPQTEEIPEDALDAVARNGVPAFFRYREAKAACGSRGRTGMDKKHKITRMVANSTIITGRIFRPAGQSARAGPGKRHGATRVPGMKSRFLTKQEGHGISVACGPACFADRLPSGLCLKSQTRRTGSCGLWHVAVDQGATVGSAHAGTETVGTLSADFAGLIGSFHDAQSPSEYRN